jgi:hypothetical protein
MRREAEGDTDLPLTDYVSFGDQDMLNQYLSKGCKVSMPSILLKKGSSAFNIWYKKCVK